MKRLPLILVAAVVVVGLVAAGVAIAASGVGGGSVAYRVNGTKVSQSTVDHQLKAIADADDKQAVEAILQTTVRTTNGAVSATATAMWLNEQIRDQLYRQEAAKAKVKVTASVREAQRKAFDQELAANNAKFKIGDLPRTLQELLIDSVVYPAALRLDSDAAVSAFLQRALRRSHITVDPRYGRWNPAQGVCPPTGCAPASAGG